MFNRREVLAAALGGGMVLKASIDANLGPIVADVLFQESFSERFFSDKNQHPVFRAGSVVIYNGDMHGHGALVERNDDLYLYTVGHVSETDPLYAHIPGLHEDGNTSHEILDPELFAYSREKTSDGDEVAWYKLEASISDRIRDLEDRGRITPLRLTSTLPEAGEYIAVPRTDTGTYSLYETLGFIPDENYLALGYIDRGAVCAGRSGSPLLATGTNDETGRIEIYSRVYGFVAAGDTRFPLEDPYGVSNACSKVVYAIPAD